MPKYTHGIVGAVEYTLTSSKKGAPIRISPKWVSANIGTVHIPQLKGVPTYGGRTFSGNVMFYKRAIPQLQAFFRAVEAAGLLKRIIFWDGSWVPRTKRGSRTSPSNHTWATAFDINAAWNGFNKRPADKGEKGYLRDLAPIAKDFGLLWGGYWDSPDGMHFEVARILSSQEINAALQKWMKTASGPTPTAPQVRPKTEPTKEEITEFLSRLPKRKVNIDGQDMPYIAVVANGTGLLPARRTMKDIGWEVQDQNGTLYLFKSSEGNSVG